MRNNLIFPIEFDHTTGGMIHSVISLVKNLKTEYNIFIIAHKEADIVKLDLGINYLLLDKPWSISVSNPLKTLATYLEIKYLLKPFKKTNTLIFTNNVGSEMIFSGFGFIPIQFKRVFVSRGGDYKGKTGYVIKRGFKSITRFIAISQAQKKRLIEVGTQADMIDIIHNGIKYPSEKSKHYNLSPIIKLSVVGYINPNKNQMLAVNTLFELINENYKVELNIYGVAFSKTDKLYNSRLISSINELKLAKHINFKGFEKDQDKIYSNTDILISCSLSEGFGRTIVEGMARGIPCIGLKESGGLQDIITHNYDGILIENNSLELKKYIAKFIEDPNFTNEVSNNAKDTFNNKFSEEIMIQNYTEFLSKNFIS